MAKKKTICDYTTEELESKLKIISNFTIVFFCIYAIVALAALGYAWSRNWESDFKMPLFLVCFGLPTFILPLLTSKAALKKELQSRDTA